MSGPTYALGDCDAVQWLRALPAESVDLVVTDPAYESLEKHRAIGTTTRLKHSKASSNDWFRVAPSALPLWGAAGTSSARTSIPRPRA